MTAMVEGTVLVTGGARRIGRAICRALAEAGWRALVHARRADDPDARALAAELGTRAFFADLSAPDGADRLFDTVCAAEPGLNAIVNNAALFSTETAERTREGGVSAEAARLLAVNAVAPERLITRLAERLESQADPDLPCTGSVVNILDNRVFRDTSDRSVPYRAFDTPYARSKAALRDAQKRLARRYGRVLRINGVAPGPVLAPIGAHEKGGAILLPARPSPEDVAYVVVFLLSARAVTGVTVPVDAGQWLLREHAPNRL